MNITQIVELLRQSFVKWATAYIYGLESAIPGLEWVALPVIAELDQAAIQAVLNALSKSIVLLGLFTLVSIEKADDAGSYIDAIQSLQALTPNASPEEFKNAENAEMAAFIRLVTVSTPFELRDPPTPT